QERRGLQGFAGFQEVGVSGGDGLVFSLVLPLQKATPPHDPPAPSSPVLFGTPLERKPLAAPVGPPGGPMLERLTEVKEVLLRSGAFGQRDLAPLGDEFRDGHVRRPPAAHSTETLLDHESKPLLSRSAEEAQPEGEANLGPVAAPPTQVSEG